MECDQGILNFVCRFCKASFDNLDYLEKHVMQIHTPAPSLKTNRFCPVCRLHCVTVDSYRDHLRYIHGQDSEGQYIIFKAFTDFSSWKNDLENRISCKFTQLNVKPLSSNEKLFIYQCRGPENAKCRGKSKRSMSKDFCQALLSVTESFKTQEVKVEYWCTHSGHVVPIEEDELRSALGSIQTSEVYLMEVEVSDNSSFDKVLHNSSIQSDILSPNSKVLFPKPIFQKRESLKKSPMMSLASVACGKVVPKKKFEDEKKLSKPQPELPIPNKNNSKSCSPPYDSVNAGNKNSIPTTSSIPVCDVDVSLGSVKSKSPIKLASKDVAETSLQKSISLNIKDSTDSVKAITDSTKSKSCSMKSSLSSNNSNTNSNSDKSTVTSTLKSKISSPDSLNKTATKASLLSSTTKPGINASSIDGKLFLINPVCNEKEAKILLTPVSSKLPSVKKVCTKELESEINSAKATNQISLTNDCKVQISKKSADNIKISGGLSTLKRKEEVNPSPFVKKQKLIDNDTINKSEKNFFSAKNSSQSLVGSIRSASISNLNNKVVKTGQNTKPNLIASPSQTSINNMKGAIPLNQNVLNNLPQGRTYVRVNNTLIPIDSLVDSKLTSKQVVITHSNTSASPIPSKSKMSTLSPYPFPISSRPRPNIMTPVINRVQPVLSSFPVRSSLTTKYPARIQYIRTTPEIKNKKPPVIDPTKAKSINLISKTENRKQPGNKIDETKLKCINSTPKSENRAQPVNKIDQPPVASSSPYLTTNHSIQVGQFYAVSSAFRKRQSDAHSILLAKNYKPGSFVFEAKGEMFVLEPVDELTAENDRKNRLKHGNESKMENDSKNEKGIDGKNEKDDDSKNNKENDNKDEKGDAGSIKENDSKDEIQNDSKNKIDNDSRNKIQNNSENKVEDSKSKMDIDRKNEIEIDSNNEMRNDIKEIENGNNKTEDNSKNEKRNDSKPEIESNSINDIKNNTKNEIVSNTKNEIESNTKNKIECNTENEIENNTKNEIESNTKNEIESNTKNEIESNTKNEIESKAENDKKNETESKAENDKKNEIQNDNKNEIENYNKNKTKDDAEHSEKGIGNKKSNILNDLCSATESKQVKEGVTIVSPSKSNIRIESVIPKRVQLSSDDIEVTKKVKYYQLEMKYLSILQECKTLKIELAMNKLKEKDRKEEQTDALENNQQNNNICDNREKQDSSVEFSDSTIERQQINVPCLENEPLIENSNSVEIGFDSVMSIQNKTEEFSTMLEENMDFSEEDQSSKILDEGKTDQNANTMQSLCIVNEADPCDAAQKEIEDAIANTCSSVSQEVLNGYTENLNSQNSISHANLEKKEDYSASGCEIKMIDAYSLSSENEILNEKNAACAEELCENITIVDVSSEIALQHVDENNVPKFADTVENLKDLGKVCENNSYDYTMIRHSLLYNLFAEIKVLNDENKMLYGQLENYRNQSMCDDMEGM